MKRFIRLVWWAAIIAAIVWLLRDRLVPAPEPIADSPPHYRVAPPPHPPEPDTVDDDLEAVKGIGPVYAARLADLGISTFASLAAADAEQLAGELDVRIDQTTDWIAQARALAG